MPRGRRTIARVRPDRPGRAFVTMLSLAYALVRNLKPGPPLHPQQTTTEHIIPQYPDLVKRTNRGQIALAKANASIVIFQQLMIVLTGPR